MAKLGRTERLRFASMGKLFDITAIFTTDEEANAYMHKNPDEGVIAVVQGVVFIANVRDAGIKYTTKETTSNAK